jgi:hypothetical protein
MSGVAKGFGVVGAIALGCVTPRGATAAEEREGAMQAEATCPATAGVGVVVCFGEGSLPPEEQGAVEEKVRELLGALEGEGLWLSGGQRLLVRVDGVKPNLVFHVEPVGEDGATPTGWGKKFAECDSTVGCTTDDWHRVVRDAMREALVELRGPVDSGPSSTRPRYRPEPLGIAGIVTASVGGLGMLTGAGLLIVGGLPDNPAPGVRQDRDLLPLSRDFYTPGAVTLGASAAVAAAGIAMVVVDFRRWKASEGAASTSGGRTRLRLTASAWGRGVQVGGRF